MQRDWWQRIADEWGKDAQPKKAEDIISNHPGYKKWLKERVVDPRKTDLNYGVVYNGPV